MHGMEPWTSLAAIIAEMGNDFHSVYLLATLSKGNLQKEYRFWRQEGMFIKEILKLLYIYIYYINSAFGH